jgi:hypothetical protein
LKILKYSYNIWCYNKAKIVSSCKCELYKFVFEALLINQINSLLLISFKAKIVYPYLAMVYKVHPGKSSGYGSSSGSDEEVELTVWDVMDFFCISPKRLVKIK